MKQVEIILSTNEQNEKLEDFIMICGKSFRYSDKRGNSRHSVISSDFAHKVINELPAKVLHAQRALDLLDLNVEIKISWDCYAPSKAERAAGKELTYEVRIHAAGQHIFTSIQQ